MQDHQTGSNEEHQPTSEASLTPQPQARPPAKKSEIADLVEFVKSDTNNEYREINLGVVHNYKAQEIAANTGVVVRNADKKITSHGIRHALVGHGDGKNEIARGQLGITTEDFERIPEVLNNADSYEEGKKKNTAVFVKKIKGKVYRVVMGMVKNKEGGHDLLFHTMFIKNA